MKKYLFLTIIYLFPNAFNAQTTYYNEVFEFKGPNSGASKVIVDDKIYILNIDTNCYLINKLRLDGTIISSKSYSYGLTQSYSNAKLHEYGNKLIAVLGISYDTTMVVVSDTIAGNILYSKKYDFGNAGSELLDNGDLVLLGDGKICNIDLTSGVVMSAFSYPTFIANNGFRIFSITKNKGSSYFIGGYKPGNSPPVAGFVLKIDNNITMVNSGFHYLPYGYGAGGIVVKNSDLYFLANINGYFQSNSSHDLLKSDTIFNGSLKSYQGIRAANNLQNTSSTQGLFITDHNLLIATNPNDLANFTYNDLVHQPEILSFDLNLNYIKTVQYPAYCYTTAPQPQINYYKGNTYITTATSTTLQGVPFNWSNNQNPTSFKYFWLYKADSLGTASCSGPMTYSVSNFSITDSVIVPYTFSSLSVVVSNTSLTFSNTIITHTITCSTITGIDEPFNENEFSLYPNPANDVLNINCSSSLKRIEVVNVTAQVLLSESVNEKTYRLQLQNFEEGIYFVKISYANGMTVTKKVIKQ